MSVVRQCMFPDVATLSPSVTLMEAARRMVQQAPGFAVVLDNMALTGLVTEFDLLKWLVRGRDPHTTFIRDLPISSPQVVHEDTQCQELLKLYNQRRFRRFPVMNEDELLSGGIMEKQILTALPRSKLLSHYRVQDILGKKSAIVTLPFTCMAAAREVVSRHLGCILLQKEGETGLAGMVTEGDVLRHWVSGNWQPEARVESIMRSDPITIEPDRDLLYAVDFFKKTGHRRVPVLTPDGTLIGLLTQTDILRQMSHSAHSRRAVMNPEDIEQPAIWFEPDGEHRILALNEKGAKALGLDAESWVGRSVSAFSTDPQLWHAVTVLLQNCGTLEKISLPLRTGDGHPLCVSSRFRLVHTPTGEDRVFWTIGGLESGRKECN
ncbi:MAG: CBS domain-containing protein [Magnetococcales bacterium]|nr:CBS domain-containing protein [Magnetococcales bacterium]